MRSLKINGTDFNLEVGTYSLEEFKKEFKHSFCIGKTDAEIEKVHAQLKAMVQLPVILSGIGKPLPEATENENENGILKTSEGTGITAKGQGSYIGKRKP